MGSGGINGGIPGGIRPIGGGMNPTTCFHFTVNNWKPGIPEYYINVLSSRSVWCKKL